MAPVLRSTLGSMAVFTAFAVATLITGTHSAEARDQIRAVGSSTVYPFITLAAERFGKGGKFKTPIVESTGTGGGFKLFCTGVGADHPDVNNASRAMTDSEKEICRSNGVSKVTEIGLGYDGIVIAQAKQSPAINLTKKDLFLALARQVPQGGKLVNNPYNTWNEVNPALPKQPISVYGPPPTSGTRDAFVELAFEEVCKAMPEYKEAYADEKERGKACKVVREDGKYIEAGEDDNLIVRKLATTPNALGILGYSFLEENVSQIKGANVDGIAPTFENISAGTYKLSRELFIYVKNDHIGQIPGLAEFAQEITSEAAFGKDGYMAQHGLIPLKDAERAESRKIASGLKAK